MATEQLPANQYAIAGQPTVTGYEVISASYGIEEDAEDKKGAGGQQKAKITYMRRQTCQLELEALAAATQGAYVVGGVLNASFAPGSVPAAVWKIRSVTESTTKGVTTVSLDLIALVDLLA
jgi:hypothetical protein